MKNNFYVRQNPSGPGPDAFPPRLGGEDNGPMRPGGFDGISVVRLLDHYQHRILSLEAAQNQQNLQNQDPQAIARNAQRIQQIQLVKTMLRRTYQELADVSGPRLHQYDIGLPKLDGMSEQEQKICENFLKAQEAQLSELLNEVSQVEHWCAEAALGKPHIFGAHFRLSKIGRMIRKLELVTGLVLRDKSHLNGHLEKILASLQHNSSAFGANRWSKAAENQSLSQTKVAAKSMVDQLAFWFTRIEKLIAKIAKLRVEIRKQDRTIEAMRIWLIQQKEKREPIPPGAVPSMVAVSHVKGFLNPVSRIQKARRLTKKAEDFCNDLLGSQREG